MSSTNYRPNEFLSWSQIPAPEGIGVEDNNRLLEGATVERVWRCPDCNVATPLPAPEADSGFDLGGICAYSVIYCLNDCPRCQQQLAAISITTCDAPLSETGINRYFWLNAPWPERATAWTITQARWPGLPVKWTVREARTAEGLIHEHLFPAFAFPHETPDLLWSKAWEAVTHLVGVCFAEQQSGDVHLPDAADTESLVSDSLEVEEGWAMNDKCFELATTDDAMTRARLETECGMTCAQAVTFFLEQSHLSKYAAAFVGGRGSPDERHAALRAVLQQLDDADAAADDIPF